MRIKQLYEDSRFPGETIEEVNWRKVGLGLAGLATAGAAYLAHDVQPKQNRQNPSPVVAQRNVNGSKPAEAKPAEAKPETKPKAKSETKPSTQASQPSTQASQPSDKPLVWGSKVSDQFRDKVRAISKKLQIDPNNLMAVMAFESGRTFSPSVRNFGGGSACGLIQFMPKTAKRLETTTLKLSKMTAEEQLDYVYKYLSPHVGRFGSGEDQLVNLYMAVLWPAAVGKPNTILFKRGTIEYKANCGLDTNNDGVITAREAANKVREQLRLGMKSAK